MTIECLSKEYDTKKAGFRNIPDYEAEQQKPAVEEEQKSKNKRDKKAYDKEMLVTEPVTLMRGHTAYLTFATKF